MTLFVFLVTIYLYLPGTLLFIVTVLILIHRHTGKDNPLGPRSVTLDRVQEI